MADKKIEKALYGPSTTEVALGAILGLAGGFLAACAYLVFKPVEQVKELPKEPSQSVVYYIPGTELRSKAQAWTTKQKTFMAGKPVELNEDELNAWSAATLGAKAAPPAAGGKSDGGGGYDGIFNPATPNFKIAKGTMQIGFKCVLNWYGLTHEVIVVSTGSFSHSGDDVVYSPQTLYLGSCPVHLIPGVAAPLMEHLLAKKKIPDDVNSAWAKVSEATLDGSTLKLTME
jgi:hypothetical protein